VCRWRAGVESGSVRTIRAASVTVVCIGSSKSKPRKGHEHPKHLPKVGTTTQRAWEHEEREREIFGAGWVRIVLAIVVVFAIAGLVFLII
jgi:hypothetical protein